MTPVLWKYYSAKDGLYPVRIRTTVTIEGKTKVSYLETGIRVSCKQFANGRVKNHTKAQEYNLKLMSLCSSSRGSKTYLDYFREHMNRPHGYYHKKKLANVLKIISDCPKVPDVSYLMRLESRLQGKHPNYIADIFTRMRVAMNLMVKAGAVEYHKNPFHNFKVKTVRTEKQRLTFEELKLLQDIKLTSRQELARDMYIVSFYQGGIRFGDLCRLKKENFSKRLTYTMHKTAKQRSLPLHPCVGAIMKKYGWSFPLKINWAHEDKSINAQNTLMNKHLKAACRAAGINEVTFHTSRHSIADLMIRKNRPLKQIQEVLGHDQPSTTEIYLRGLYQEETDQGLSDLFS